MGMMSTRWGAAGEPCPLTHLPQPPRQLGDDVGSELTHGVVRRIRTERLAGCCHGCCCLDEGEGGDRKQRDRSEEGMAQS